jgi:gluconolactonase
MPWIWRINLTDFSNPVTEKVYPHPQLTVPNGADYYDGYVYWAQEGNYTHPGGVVKMHPRNLTTEMVNNNFYGHRFNSLNDIVLTDNGVCFFTDGYYGATFNDTIYPQLANGVYRWDTKTGNIKMVAGAADMSLYNPNGLALNAKQDKLFVTNRGNSSDDSFGARTIYSFDVTSTGLKNQEVFAYVDAGFPDGVKTDRDGRVYGAVTGGVDVFDKSGTLIDKIKVDTTDVAVNMMWVDDWFYIVGRSHIYRVQLNSGRN